MKKVVVKSFVLILSLLAIVKMFFLHMTVEASEIVDSGTYGENLTWTLDNDGVLTISGIGDMYDVCAGKDGTLLPDSVLSKVKSVILSEGVTSVGAGAFYGSKNLKNITIPKGVTKIGANAFEGCEKLTNVKIPENVTVIEDGAFRYCKSITKIKIPDSVTYIGPRVFEGCTKLTDITISKNIKVIEEGTFRDCGLTSIIIPEGVTSIGKQAFEICISLTNITIPKSLTSIGDEAFTCCTNINISDLESLWKLIYANNESNLLAKIPGGNLYVNSQLLTDLVIPDGVKKIPDHAFENRASITTVYIPESVTSIGDYAFFGCNNITSVTISEGVTGIGDYAFSECKSMSSIIIPESITSIGNYALYGCSGLKSVMIPKSVTKMENTIVFDYDNVYISDFGLWWKIDYLHDEDETLSSVGNGKEINDGTGSFIDISISNGINKIPNYQISNKTDINVSSSEVATSNNSSQISGSGGVESISASETAKGNNQLYSSTSAFAFAIIAIICLVIGVILGALIGKKTKSHS